MDLPHLRDTLAALFAPFASARDDADLARWIEASSIQSLPSLLDYQVRPGIQARVVTIMLVPDGSDLPFPVGERYELLTFARSLPALGRLSLPVLEYMVDVIHAWREHDVYGNAFGSMDHRLVLLELLAHLPDGPHRDLAFAEFICDEPQLVFARLDRDDPDYGEYLPDKHIDTRFGFFERLMADPRIDPYYKRECDVHMRAVVTGEIPMPDCMTGHVDPALPVYAAAVSRLIATELGPPYDQALAEDQIRFLLDLATPGAFHHFFADRLTAALAVINDPALYRRLARAYVLGGLECSDLEPHQRPQGPPRLIDIGYRDYDGGMLTYEPGPSQTDFCGRLTAFTDDGLNLAWELLMVSTDDPEMTAALSAIIEEIQGEAPTAELIASRRAAHQATLLRRLCEP